MKVLTGKEVIVALLEGETLGCEENGHIYKFEGDELLSKLPNDSIWGESFITLNTLLSSKFTEYVPEPQVGNWVKVFGYLGKITRVDGKLLYAYWSNYPEKETSLAPTHGFEILTPEQVTEYKREQAFKQAGRKLNEFNRDDIVKYNGITCTVHDTYKESYCAELIVKVAIRYNETGNPLQEVQRVVKPEELTPVCFVENIIDLTGK